jgi:tetratricopeptide (TPR) repeat protein
MSKVVDSATCWGTVVSKYDVTKTLSLAVALIFSSASTGNSAPPVITSLHSEDDDKCEKPTLSEDYIIGYCGAMLRLGLHDWPNDGTYHYPKNGIARETLLTGLAFQRKGNEEFARKYFDFAIKTETQALQSSPSGAENFGERCWLRAVINVELETGLADCERGLQIKPDDYEILRNKGLILYRQGRYQEALASCNASAQQKPADAFNLFLRGVVKQKLGDTSFDADYKSAA